MLYALVNDVSIDFGSHFCKVVVDFFGLWPPAQVFLFLFKHFHIPSDESQLQLKSAYSSKTIQRS